LKHKIEVVDGGKKVVIGISKRELKRMCSTRWHQTAPAPQASQTEN